MSDIKYIIAGSDDDAEHTRFGCLAMVRYAVAAVVTVLTITVIALSIHAVLRSEDMGLSVNKGFIGADTLWSHMFSPNAVTSKSPVPSAGKNHPTSSINKVAEPATAAAKLNRRRGLMDFAPKDTDESELSTGAATLSVGASSSRSLPKDCILGCSGGDGDEPTQVTFKKADRTNLRIILIANNPGGRTKIDCNGTRVSLFDMYSPYGQIGDVTQLDNFTVPPLTTVTLQKRLSITNTSYIWENYHLASRFSVQVRVTSDVTSYPLGKRGKTVQQTYMCRPVTIGLIDDEAIYASDDHVHCTATSSG
ncbi:uncharacterized protein [Miscanthus floridulus]|uniref:uncharacterized protein n=1 Tax=Miscanthus floridulus TaxID=154761 RepID=UPI003459107F